ncbi:MAG: magnesium/cobalt transporter CorA [Chitinophagales bacterium]|nr:magnesium/cobalt transporter CorA [Chitinophagales bacterium]
MNTRRYRRGLAKLLPEWTWNIDLRKPLTSFNPTKIDEQRVTEVEPVYSVFDFDATTLEERKNIKNEECNPYIESGRVTWINVDGINKAEVEKLCKHYGIHHLTIEDILSSGQRAKMDDSENVIFCLLPMLYYNNDTGQVESEQVSIVLGADFVISFQEDPKRDVFDPVRERIRNPLSRVRKGTADYLCYSLIDIIVDSYFGIIEKINERIERLEDILLLQKREQAILSRLSILRREVMVMRRSIAPVKDLVQAFIKSQSELLEEEHEKYYKDVLDHITQASEYTENHRDMVMNLQDLSMSQINLRMNEVMKVFTLLATLMAPATLIGGIFGMNFDVIPLSHQQDGFYITVGLMLLIPLIMWWYFKRKGWF